MYSNMFCVFVIDASSAQSASICFSYKAAITSRT